MGKSILCEIKNILKNINALNCVNFRPVELKMFTVFRLPVHCQFTHKRVPGTVNSCYIKCTM